MQKAILFLLLSILLCACDTAEQSATESTLPNLDNPPTAAFIGNSQCIQCHSQQVEQWRGSHHDLAMQVATEDTVLGDFNNSSHSKDNVTTRFFRDGDSFMINTQGSDGSYQDFEISHTFGVTPLQQYLIPFTDGRLQAFSVAWDTRTPEDGGQRWFRLYPDETINYNDELHWTGINQNWNYMCAECHSTQFKKGYDSNNKTYQSSWSEINVSCEACHGPASGHIAWTENKQAVGNKGFVFDLAQEHQWQFSPGANTTHRNNAAAREEVETCARCHSRRGVLTEDYQFGHPIGDSHRVSLLRDGLYYADGQIEDEVYVYGSFLQSKMYQQGVTCSDCHNPHSLELKQPGDGTCLQCHASNKFATSNHHHHPEKSSAARCVSCHMPATTYMVVDPRRDHSFRIPRPDLSASIDTPNSCNQCHDKQTAQWAAEQINKWYPAANPGYQRYAPVLFAARTGYSEATPALQQLLMDPQQPAIARATAASLLVDRIDQQGITIINQALGDDSAMVRAATLSAMDSVPANIRLPLAIGLANDPVRLVRNSVGRVLADIPDDQLKPDQLKALQQARQGFIDSQRANGDRPEAQANLGNYYSQRNNFTLAEQAYLEAIRLEATYTPAYINLASLYSHSGREQQAEDLLKRGLLRVRAKATLYHAIGLLWVRQQRSDEALAMLGRAASEAPENVRYSFVFAIALHDLGKPEQSVDVLKKALLQHPQNAQLITALFNYLTELGRDREAEQYKAMLE